jgi:hypothetical protein
MPKTQQRARRLSVRARRRARRGDDAVPLRLGVRERRDEHLMRVEGPGDGHEDGFEQLHGAGGADALLHLTSSMDGATLAGFASWLVSSGAGPGAILAIDRAVRVYLRSCVRRRPLWSS